MPGFGSIDEIFEFAIAREEEAAQFYLEQAARMSRPEMRRTFEDFSREERGHKAKLIAIRDGRLTWSASRKIADLKIADSREHVRPDSEMSYADMLVLAMQREKAAFRLYSDLAEAAPDEGTRQIFESLAQEEAKHKLRFELEYDREMNPEN